MWKFHQTEGLPIYFTARALRMQFSRFRADTPYNAECGVIRSLSLSRFFHNLCKDERKWLHTFVLYYWGEEAASSFILYYMRMWYTAAILALCVVSGCSQNSNFKSYEPNEQFAPAYTCLTEHSDTTFYDINATIRVIRAAELASENVGDLISYLDLLKRQDYRFVPQDVVDAEKNLFPAMQALWEIEQEYAQTQNTTWRAIKIIQSSWNQLRAEDKTLIPGLEQTATVFDSEAALNSVFNSVIENVEENRRMQRSLDRIKMVYLTAFKEYWQVSVKYMEEWERLCREKDEAYVDLYAGGCINCFNIAHKILEKYPIDSDALLIKAMSYMNRDTLSEGDKIQINSLLDNYKYNYPTKTAPALLLEGILARNSGDIDKAIQYFDQASIEYPRTAERVSDLLDAYVNRPYFAQTVEGLRFMQMYKATLLGNGLFSPNFQKAIIYFYQDKNAKAKEEIYNHFFRRGNQDVQDYLLNDLEFCENTTELFLIQSLSFPERMLIDLKFDENEKSAFWNKGEIKSLNLEFYNHSGRDLKNVRIFLCNHLVEMAKGDYRVVPLPSKNILKNDETYSLQIKDKDLLSKLIGEKLEINQIVGMRAIFLTDHDVFWVDTSENRLAFNETPEDSDPFWREDAELFEGGLHIFESELWCPYEWIEYQPSIVAEVNGQKVTPTSYTTNGDKAFIAQFDKKLEDVDDLSISVISKGHKEVFTYE